MIRASLNPKEALCDACGWQGIPAARTLRYLIGPSYLILSVIACKYLRRLGAIDHSDARSFGILHRHLGDVFLEQLEQTCRGLPGVLSAPVHEHEIKIAISRVRNRPYEQYGNGAGERDLMAQDLRLRTAGNTGKSI